MKEFTALAWREGKWWVADVPGVGATQARRLADLRARLTDMLATALQCEPEQVHVDVRLRLPDDVRSALDRAAQLRVEAAAAQREAAAAVRKAAASLHAEGVTVRDIGTALGVSYQRAHQLLHDG